MDIETAEEEQTEPECEQCGNLEDDCECCYECGEYDCVCGEDEDDESTNSNQP